MSGLAVNSLRALRSMPLQNAVNFAELVINDFGRHSQKFIREAQIYRRILVNSPLYDPNQELLLNSKRRFRRIKNLTFLINRLQEIINVAIAHQKNLDQFLELYPQNINQNNELQNRVMSFYFNIGRYSMEAQGVLTYLIHTRQEILDLHKAMYQELASLPPRRLRPDDSWIKRPPQPPEQLLPTEPLQSTEYSQPLPAQNRGPPPPVPPKPQLRPKLTETTYQRIGSQSSQQTVSIPYNQLVPTQRLRADNFWIRIPTPAIHSSSLPQPAIVKTPESTDQTGAKRPDGERQRSYTSSGVLSSSQISTTSGTTDDHEYKDDLELD
jgi:hypothetical protein